jgi:hypothetical protein
MAVRVNKKQRKKYRQAARDFVAQAESIATADPARATTLGRIGRMFTRLGSPPKSKARLSSHEG